MAQIGAGRRLLHRDPPPRELGTQGQATAYEIEPNIAGARWWNFARYPQVEVRRPSGVDDLPAADAIYVNAASHPVRAWVDALKPGGRLVFPLQAAGSSGAMALVTPLSAATPGRRACSGTWCSSPAKGRRMPRWAASSTRRSAAVRERPAPLRFGAAPSETDWVRLSAGAVDRASRLGFCRRVDRAPRTTSAT